MLAGTGAARPPSEEEGSQAEQGRSTENEMILEPCIDPSDCDRGAEEVGSAAPDLRRSTLWDGKEGGSAQASEPTASEETSKGGKKEREDKFVH